MEGVMSPSVDGVRCGVKQYGQHCLCVRHSCSSPDMETSALRSSCGDKMQTAELVGKVNVCFVSPQLSPVCFD